MKTREVDELEHRISQMREEMIQIAKANGLNSQKTVCYSRNLDQFITIYQKLSCKKETKKL